MEIGEVEFGLIEIAEVEIPERFFLAYFFSRGKRCCFFLDSKEI